MSGIIEIKAREILDSRGNPTGRSRRLSRQRRLRPRGSAERRHPPASTRRSSSATATPSGTWARVCEQAVQSVEEQIAPRYDGLPASRDQMTIDRTMIELDGTANKGKLGANAMLGGLDGDARAPRRWTSDFRSIATSAGRWRARCPCR